MGTYDTRGGSPISPNDPDFSPTQLEEDVLGVLETLDVAREAAREVLPKLFADLVRKRYPPGTIIDLRGVVVMHGSTSGATQAKVLRVIEPEILLSNPEGTRVQVECVCLKKDGSNSKSRIRFNEPVLSRKYELGIEDKPISERDQLTNLLRDLALGEEPAADEPVLSR